VKIWLSAPFFEPPASLLDHSSAAGETHIATFALVPHKMALVQTIRCIGKLNPQVGHIRAVYSAVSNGSGVVEAEAVHGSISAGVRPGKVGAVLHKRERD
jgi:hypothetical protein